MRNAVSGDWDLFELKKANFPITRGKSIPVFTSKVMESIQQLKSYRKLLTQDAVKKVLFEE